MLLDIPEYVTWPVDGAYGIRAMLANNIDRDGRYYETSTLYSLHTRNLYETFAAPLKNYRGRVYPHGLNLYDDPRFQAFMLLPQMSLVCLGHNPSFGDDSPATKRRLLPYHPPRCFDSLWTEYLVDGVSDPGKRAEYAALLRYLRSRDPDSVKEMRDTEELRLFHGLDELVADGAEPNQVLRQRLDGSFFYGQKGLAVMRLGKMFKDPPLEYRIQFLLRTNDEVEKEDLEHQIRSIAKQGGGGVFAYCEHRNNQLMGMGKSSLS